MNQVDYSSLLNLIPPALIISLLAYFTRFFGKIITDQQPFFDDRDWGIEIAGMTYMVNLCGGVVGIALALRWPISIHWLGHVVILFVVSLVSGIFLFSNSALSSEFFNIGLAKARGKGLYEFFLKTGKHIPMSIPPIILFYLATIEYLSHNILWIILIWSVVFFTLIQSAYNFSLRKNEKRVPVDIFFTDSTTEPLKGVIILKVNEDNVRLRSGDKIIILNKDLISRIEMVIPEDMR